MVLFVFLPELGVIVTDMEWSYTSSKPIPSQPDVLEIDMSVDSLETASGIDGRRMWRVGIFASKRRDGTGPRQSTNYQILNTFQARKPLVAGQRLNIDTIATRFDLDEINCDSGYRYLCLEFAKSMRPLPDFEFTTTTGGNTIIRCKEHECDRGET